MPRLERRPRSTYSPQSQGALCDECPLKGRTPVPPEPAYRTPTMVLLGESPGDVEAFKARPFVGPTGREVNRALQDAGIRRADLHVTNALACKLDRTLSPSALDRAIACCRPRLVDEMRYVPDDTVILACGLPSVAMTLGVKAMGKHVGVMHRGAFEFNRFNVMPTWHPTYAFFRKRSLRPIFTAYLERAWKRTTWDWGEIITGASEQALEGLRRLRGSGALGFDVENVPSQEVLTCLGLSDGNLTVTVPWDSYSTAKYGSVAGLECYGALGQAIKHEVHELLSCDHLIVLQNGAHDIREIRRKGIEVELGFDIMLAHATVYPQLPHNLEDIALQYFPCNRWKSDFKVSTEAKGLDVYVERPFEELCDYNAKDTCATVRLYPVLMRELDRMVRHE